MFNDVVLVPAAVSLCDGRGRDYQITEGKVYLLQDKIGPFLLSTPNTQPKIDVFCVSL